MVRPLTFTGLLLRCLLVAIFLTPVAVSGQITIKGRILNQADTKPVASASVFLSNASVGTKTADDGAFTLTGVKPGKYDLVVSIVGFDAFKQTITVQSSNIIVPDILIFPKTIALTEVKVTPKTDPNRELYFEIFKKEFLGGSDLARECKILNRQVLDFEYDDKQSRLTASSVDFLIIENAGLGYRIKYLLNNFTKDNKDEMRQSVHYDGSYFFENLEGSASQKREWEKRRQEVYEGSPKHFLRATLSNRLNEEGFRVFQYAIYQNPQRPPDSVITAKIKYFKEEKSKDRRNSDSLSFWEKKQKLKKTLTAVMHYPLNKDDLVKLTDKKGIYAISCENDGLHVTYNKSRRFSSAAPVENLSNIYNKDVTLVNFNNPVGYFDDNGVYTNPNSIVYTGAWGKRRMAELLPTDYSPPQTNAAMTQSKSPEGELEDFKSVHIAEHAYLHFDKPYYAAGDTIYFKAYVTMGDRHQLTQLSGVLHVDLINTQNKIDQSLLLKISDGVCWGDFALPDSLPKGEYQVRAYTNWMRNRGEVGFYSRSIPIGSAQATKVTESATSLPKSSKPDLQFFPESGDMVAGVKSKIAFKAIGPNGMGLDVKGSIIDGAGKTITTFASAHMGMGFFEILPEAGKNYKAAFAFADGTQSAIDLPVVQEKGIALKVNNDSLQKVSVTINTNAAYFQQNKDKEYTLLVYSGGMITTVKCLLDSAVMKFDFVKRRLRTGVNTITLFSPNGQPLAERLFFVQNYDKLNLAVSAGKTTYAPREKVSIKLNAKNRADSVAAGHFSVSVIDEGKVPVNENIESTILSNLLLTDDLKGNVEQPNYYFTNITGETLKNLDLVMLTHGYRNFEWKEVLNNDDHPIKYQPEKNLEIAGVAKMATGTPLAKGTVSLIAPFTIGPVLTETTDDKGNFRFTNLVYNDSAKFILQAVNAKADNNTILSYTEGTTAPVTTYRYLPKIQADTGHQLKAYMLNNAMQREQLMEQGLITGKMLNEVKISARKLTPVVNDTRYGVAEQEVDGAKIEYGGFLADRLLPKLRGISFLVNGRMEAVAWVNRNLHGINPHPMMIVVDGIEMGEGYDVNSINTGSIDKVEVMTDATVSPGGVLIINTVHGVPLRDIKSKGILPIKVKGFYLARQFYSPKYEGLSATKLIDLRSTIYWNPELTPDKDGNATIDFYNADAPGSYRVVIEGIDEKGVLGRQVYRYIVK